MPGFLAIPQLLCADCGHVPMREPVHLNRNPQIRRKMTVSCQNAICGQFQRLFDVELQWQNITPAQRLLPSEEAAFGKKT